MYDLHDFLMPIDLHQLNGDGGYNDGQLAKHIDAYETGIPDISKADIVLVGVGETRGSGIKIQMTFGGAVDVGLLEKQIKC